VVVSSVFAWTDFAGVDRFNEEHDEPVLGLQVTRQGQRALDALAELAADEDADDAPTVELECQHPPEARVAVHDDLPDSDADQLFLCAMCGDERSPEGWWAA